MAASSSHHYQFVLNSRSLLPLKQNDSRQLAIHQELSFRKGVYKPQNYVILYHEIEYLRKELKKRTVYKRTTPFIHKPHKFSLLVSIHFVQNYLRELVWNSRQFILVIISLILMTCMCCNTLMWLGEILCWSLPGLNKGFIHWDHVEWNPELGALVSTLCDTKDSSVVLPHSRPQSCDRPAPRIESSGGGQDNAQAQ